MAYMLKNKNIQNPESTFLFPGVPGQFSFTMGTYQIPWTKNSLSFSISIEHTTLFNRTWIHLHAPTDCPTGLSWLYLKQVASHFITILTSAPELQTLKEQHFQIISFNSLHFTDEETEVFPHSFPS